MTEDQAFELAKKARWLHALIGQVERDYVSLISAKLVKAMGEMAEFDNLPLFLDLAEELAGSVSALCDEMLSGFDRHHRPR